MKNLLAGPLGERGLWLAEEDFIATDQRTVHDLGRLGFPRDWPTVYSSSSVLKSLIGKKGRCAARQVVVLGPPSAEQLKLVSGLHFRALQSFSNAELAAQASGLGVCRGWAIFEQLDQDSSAAFVAERYWWNSLEDGTWVDFTPRPAAWQALLLAAGDAPKEPCSLSQQHVDLASHVYALCFGEEAPRLISSGNTASSTAAPQTAGPVGGGQPNSGAAGGEGAKSALALAVAEADEACAELRRLEAEARELREKLQGAVPQHARWNANPEALKPGARGKIHGLSKSADLNGQEVTLLSWEERRGRWKVRLRTGEVRAVLPENLELVDEVKEQAELSTFGCEVIGHLPCEGAETEYHLWPLVYSGIIRVRLPDRLVARLNVQFDELYSSYSSSSHAPYLQGEMKEGRQLTVRKPDDEYVALLMACCEKLSKAILREEAEDFQYQLDSVWTVHQFAGDYNPVHFHNNARSHFGFSSFLHLQLPPQLNVGQAWLPRRGSKGYHDGMTSFIWRTDSGLSREHLENPGVLECELLEGYLYVFPQWVQHFVWPFRGEGERRTVAANISLQGSSERAGLKPAGGGGGLYR